MFYMLSAVFFGSLLVSIAYVVGHFITVRWIVSQKPTRVLALLSKISRAERVKQSELCERIRYGKPRYHTIVVWARSASLRMLARITACLVVRDTREIIRYTTSGELNDYLVLNRIDYLAEKTPSFPFLFLSF